MLNWANIASVVGSDISISRVENPFHDYAEHGESWTVLGRAQGNARQMRLETARMDDDLYMLEKCTD